MFPGAELERGLTSIRLQNAVLCVDCEIVSNSAHDECSICGSRSLLSLQRMLGGALGDDRRVPIVHSGKKVRYDLELTLKAHDIGGNDMTAVIESITRLGRPEVGGVVESLHINVESVVEYPRLQKAA